MLGWMEYKMSEK